MLSAEKGHNETVQVLVDLGADDVDKADYDGQTGA